MAQKKNDRLVKVVLGFIIGFGIVLGLLSLLLLFSGDLGAFFGIAVTGGGFAGLGWAGRKLLLTPKEEQHKMQSEWSEKPWTQRKDWAEGKVIQEGAQNLGLLIGFTILWNVICWGIFTFAFVSEKESGDVPWFILIFPLVGFLLIIITTRVWIRRRKFGISIMNLDTLPAYLGERLKGSIETGVSALDDPARSFQVKFLCAQRKSSHDTKGKKRVSEEELWSHEQEVYAQLSESMETLNVSIYFNIPPDFPPTELIPADDRILWRINITSEVPGVNYAAKFEIPVYPYNPER